jgi:kynureninase
MARSSGSPDIDEAVDDSGVRAAGTRDMRRQLSSDAKVQGMPDPTRDACLALDRDDVLAPLRTQFALDAADAGGLVYLDGNSLGPLPRAAIARVRQVVDAEWGAGLIRSWNDAGWITLSQRIAGKIARLLGAGPGELVVADSTSVNLYKVLSAAAWIAAAETPSRRVVLSDRTNFPTDLYVADTLARQHGLDLRLVDADDVAAAIADDTAVVLLTHVDYRTGRMHDMPAVTRAAHAAGALVIWDLAHSAGAVPVQLHGDGSPEGAADFAVGCGYKYLNGGPGAPAYLWAHPRHTRRMDAEGWRQPLAGWFGHAAPFEFATGYRPAAGSARFQCGTPPIVSLAALECGVDTVLAADEAGGVAALRSKSLALTDLFIALVEQRCGGHGLTIVTPREPSQRGSQVSLAHADGACAMVQALSARGVIGDFRAPDILRFGFAPLYTRFVDVWDAVDRLAQVLESGEWREARFRVRAAVT